jgi:glycosyltransferase involved in cell wall biosynthesis
MQLVCHPGTQHSWQTALAFQEAGTLDKYITSFFYHDKSFFKKLIKVLPEGLKGKLEYEFSRRSFAQLHIENVAQHGVEEFLEICFNRLNLPRVAAKIDQFGNERFYKHVNRYYNKNKLIDSVWSYNNSSLEIFQNTPSNVTKILDQTIGHWSTYNEIISNEFELHREFFRDLPIIEEPVIERNNKEIELADLVIVGSDFCSKTLQSHGLAENKIKIVPYGYDESIFNRNKEIKPSFKGKIINFVFVGSLIPRKGIHYLLEAFSLLDKSKYKLTLAGPNGLPEGVLTKYLSENITYIGSFSRSDIPKVLDDMDVFIFPSLFEGGGIVLYEAAASGLAIIQSKHCGDGVGNSNGLILDEVSIESIVESVITISSDPEKLQDMKEKSIDWAKSRSWGNYRESVRSLLKV